MKTKNMKKPSALAMASALFIGSTPFLMAQEVTIGGIAIEDASAPGTPLTGDMIVEGDATVNGSLFVQPDAAPVDTVSAAGAIGVPPSIVDNSNGTSTVSSRISTVDAQRVANTAGGVQLDANGNVTLMTEETTTSDFRYGIFSQFDVDNATNTPIGPTTYVAGIVDEDGNLVSVLAGVPVDITDPDPLNWTIDLNDPNLDTDDILVTTQSTSSNGNLVVGGNAEIAGTLTVDGVDVATSDDIAAEEAARIAAIDAEEAARIAADNALQANIDAEEAARIAAIDAEEAARIAADNALQANIDAEVAERTSLIRSTGLNAEGNQIIRIGDNSLVTEEVGGQQLLYAEDAGDNPIDIRITNGSNLIVDGSTTTGSLNVLNDALIGGNLTVNGATTLNGGLNVTGGTTTDTLTVTGASTFTGIATFQNDINAQQDINVGGRINVAEDVFVGGRAQGLQAQTDANSAAIANNRRDIEKNRRGIAMVAAMTQSTVLPGMTHALDANVAHFEGKTGMAISYSRRINENVQLNLAGASTTDFKESVIRGGVGVQW